MASSAVSHLATQVPLDDRQSAFLMLAQLLDPDHAQDLITLCPEGVRSELRNIDCRVLAAVSEIARKNDVPVQNGSHLIGNGLVHVVPFDKDGVKSGDRTLIGVTCPFKQAW